jgi:hypothetical protein
LWLLCGLTSLGLGCALLYACAWGWAMIQVFAFLLDGVFSIFLDVPSRDVPLPWRYRLLLIGLAVVGVLAVIAGISMLVVSIMQLLA